MNWAILLWFRIFEYRRVCGRLLGAGEISGISSETTSSVAITERLRGRRRRRLGWNEVGEDLVVWCGQVTYRD